MSLLCQMAWTGKPPSEKRSVTVGPISNSATPSRLTATRRHASLDHVRRLSEGRVALFPFLPSGGQAGPTQNLKKKRENLIVFRLGVCFNHTLSPQEVVCSDLHHESSRRGVTVVRQCSVRS